VPHLPENARLWLERAEIDYIGPFVKAWASFNAWYRHASNTRKDADGLRYVKQQPNPVRNAIMPLLRPVQLNGHGEIIPDDGPAQKFKLLIRDLHVCLDNFHIEVMREDVLERISFRAVCLGRGPTQPQVVEAYRLRYRVEKTNGRWKSTVRSTANGDVRAEIEQDVFDVNGLQDHEQYARLSLPQRACLLDLYRRCDPRPFTDLLAGPGDPIIASDIEFRCRDEQLFAALIEVIYAMRNALLHGELQPHEQAFAAYEPAYRIVMRFLKALRP
jgi:hypothetical protein